MAEIKMDISPNYHLIPYPDQDYQLKPFAPENPVLKQNGIQETIAGDNCFRRPRPNIHTIHIDVSNHTYGAEQSYVYFNIDQVGHLIDIYA
jgi:hypothetical protein